MKKIIKRILCTVLLTATISGNIVSANAATLSKTSESSDTFAVPSGGYSICAYRVTLSEDYEYNSGSKLNKFQKHTKSYCYKMTYATTKPTIAIGNIIHYTSSGSIVTTYSSFKKGSVVYPSTYDVGQLYYNTSAVSYGTTTGNYSFLAFTVSCSGALVPTKPHTMKLPLATS